MGTVLRPFLMYSFCINYIQLHYLLLFIWTFKKKIYGVPFETKQVRPYIEFEFEATFISGMFRNNLIGFYSVLWLCNEHFTIMIYYLQNVYVSHSWLQKAWCTHLSQELVCGVRSSICTANSNDVIIRRHSSMKKVIANVNPGSIFE